jgi:hypothetical protein
MRITKRALGYGGLSVLVVGLTVLLMACGGSSSSRAITAAASSGSPSAPAPGLRFLDRNNCLSCHGNPALSKKQPDGSSISLYVSAGDLNGAVHRYEDCTTCHTINPHGAQTSLTKRTQAETCGSCHQYEYSQYQSSIHGTSQQPSNSDPATCTDCHSTDSNPHNVVNVQDPLASTYPTNIAQTCAKCHNDPKVMNKYGIVEKVYATYMRSYHGQAMELAPKDTIIQQLNVATCVSCHGSHSIKVVGDPAASIVGMDHLLKTCQQCHADAGPGWVRTFLGHKSASSSVLPQAYWGGKAFFILSRAMLVGGVLITATSIGLRGGRRIRRNLRRRMKERGADK